MPQSRDDHGLSSGDEEHQARQLILTVAKQLPAIERLCIEYLYEDGLSIKEVALKLGQPPAEVARHCRSATSLLRQLLDGQHES